MQTKKITKKKAKINDYKLNLKLTIHEKEGLKERRLSPQNNNNVSVILKNLKITNFTKF